MTRFLVLYKSPVSAVDMMANATPEQAQAGMDGWMVWAGKAGDAIVDLGTPLGNAATITAASAGPGTSQITGYSIMEADSRDAVLALFDGHPHIHGPDASIDVLECLPTPGT